jgi:hypothetical protein
MFFVLQKTRRCSTWEVSCAASSARWWWAAGWTPGVRARAPALDRPPGGPAQPTGARACSSWSVGLRPAASELLLHTKFPLLFLPPISGHGTGSRSRDRWSDQVQDYFQSPCAESMRRGPVMAAPRESRMHMLACLPPGRYYSHQRILL